MEPSPSLSLPRCRASQPVVQASGLAEASEEALVARAVEDRSAFAELYRRHYATIGAYLLRRCGNVHATEDMLSETFLSALRALPRFRRTGVPFRHWLYRIATNVAGKRARSLRVAIESLDDPRTLVDARSLTAPEGHDPELLRAVLALAPDHQAVLTLHYVEGLRVDEIARVLDVRVGTVKSRLSRARGALAARLKR